MKTTIIDNNLVLVANDVNLSIFKPWWLINQGILNENEIRDDFVFSPVAIQIPTNEFQLNILPNRIQLAIPPQSTDTTPIIERVLGGIVKTLPHTPFSGVGLNFNYHIIPDDPETFVKWNKELFSSKIASLFDIQDDSKPKYGSYLSFNVLSGRLKLNIKPVIVNETLRNAKGIFEKKTEVVHVNYNYDFDIMLDAQEPYKRILDILMKWEEAKDLSDKLVAKLGGSNENNT